MTTNMFELLSQICKEIEIQIQQGNNMINQHILAKTFLFKTILNIQISEGVSFKNKPIFSFLQKLLKPTLNNFNSFLCEATPLILLNCFDVKSIFQHLICFEKDDKYLRLEIRVVCWKFLVIKYVFFFSQNKYEDYLYLTSKVFKDLV